MEIISENAEATRDFGRKIADILIKGGLRKPSEEKTRARICALSGDLGSGKTTFVQGMAEGLGISLRVISPTFIILKKYEISSNKARNAGLINFYHIDLYRLEGEVEREIRNLGLDDFGKNAGNILAVEWAERAGEYFKGGLWVKFENLGEDERKITVDIKMSGGK